MMQKVIILTEQEYEELIQFQNEILKRMEEIENIMEDKGKLQNYIFDWLG